MARSNQVDRSRPRTPAREVGPMTDTAIATRQRGGSPRPIVPPVGSPLLGRLSHPRDEWLDPPRLGTLSRGRSGPEPSLVRGPRAMGALVLGILCLASGCQPPGRVEAQVAYDRGSALFDQGKTEEAIAQFRRA